MTPAQILFSFKGRINRQPFWLYNIALAIVFNIIIYFLFSLELDLNYIFTIMAILYIPLLWASFALLVKRLHDLDKSGWMALLAFIPLANIYLFIITAFFKGTTGPNRFGPDPLESNSNQTEKTEEKSNEL